MSNQQIEKDEFAQAVKAAGLDFLDDNDYKLFRDALKQSEPGSDLSEILANARAKRSGTAELDKAFAHLGEDASKVIPRSKPEAEKTGYETLDDYFENFTRTI